MALTRTQAPTALDAWIQTHEGLAALPVFKSDFRLQ